MGWGRGRRPGKWGHPPGRNEGHLPPINVSCLQGSCQLSRRCSLTGPSISKSCGPGRGDFGSPHVELAHPERLGVGPQPTGFWPPQWPSADATEPPPPHPRIGADTVPPPACSAAASPARTPSHPWLQDGVFPGGKASVHEIGMGTPTRPFLHLLLHRGRLPRVRTRRGDPHSHYVGVASSTL